MEKRNSFCVQKFDKSTGIKVKYAFKTKWLEVRIYTDSLDSNYI